MEKEFTRRDFLKLGSTAAVAAALAACQPKATPTEAPEPEDEPTEAPEATEAPEPTEEPEPTDVPEPEVEEVTIQMMYWPVGGDRGIEAMNAALVPFNEQYPHITVETLPTPWGELHDKFLTMSAGGSPPDVSAIDNYFTSLFASKGVLLPLDPIIESDDDFSLDPYFEAALAEGVWEGTRWVLPFIGSTRVMYFNIDLFEERGLTRPDEMWETGEWTWDNFLQTAQEITDLSGGPAEAVYGCQADNSMYGGLPPWIWGNGGDVLNEARTECEMAEDRAVEAIAFCQALIYEHEVAPTAQVMQDVDLVATGRIGVWPSWRGLSMSYRAFDYNWDVAPFPMGSEGKLTLYKGNAVGVAKQTPNPDQAWLVCRHMSSKEADAIWVSNGGATPRRDNFDVLMSSTPPENNQYFYEPLDEGWARLLPFTPSFREWVTELQPFLDRIFLENEDVKTVMEEAVPVVNEILASE